MFDSKEGFDDFSAVGACKRLVWLMVLAVFEEKRPACLERFGWGTLNPWLSGQGQQRVS